MKDSQVTIGPFLLDRAGRTLARDGVPLPVNPRQVALLEALVGAPAGLASKAVLVEAAWPGAAVEESNLTVQISALRKIMGHQPSGRPWIETVPRLVYRLGHGLWHPSTSDLKPVIAVLPFTHLGEST